MFKDWIGLCSVLRPRQHSIGYMGAGFYRSKENVQGWCSSEFMWQRVYVAGPAYEKARSLNLADSREEE